MVFVDPLHLEAFRIRENFSADNKVQFKDFLSNNQDVFTWFLTDMSGVDPSIIYHRLSINPEIKLVK